MAKTVSIKTLGCKLNQYESALIADRFARRGWDVLDDIYPAVQRQVEWAEWTQARQTEAARWEALRAAAKQPDIGKRIDDALSLIEAENPKLKGILDKRFARAQLPDGKLGDLVDRVSTIGFGSKVGLATLRDTLLPRLISGQLRLPPAEVLAG